MRSARLGVGVGEFGLYKRSEWASARTSLVEWSLGGQSDANLTHLNTRLERKMTTAMMKGFVLFVCLFLAVVQSITCEANRIDARKKHENDVAHHSSATTSGAWNQEKPKRLFARTRYLSQQRHHVVRPKPRPEAVSPAQTPARRCAGLMESCSPLTPCCDPCASCHCRLFNTICHCWRLGHLCPKKT